MTIKYHSNIIDLNIDELNEIKETVSMYKKCFIILINEEYKLLEKRQTNQWERFC